MQPNFLFPPPRESTFKYYGPSVWKEFRPLLRAAQDEAICKIKNNLTAEKPIDPSIAVLPTGSGKTGIIAVLPYILECRKVLVIEPSLQMRRQMSISLGENRDPEKTFLLKLFTAKYPNQVKEIDSHKDSIIPKGRIELTNNLFDSSTMSDLIVTNFHKDPTNIQDRNLFDLIIVDEAHHLPAATWRKIIEHFQAKKVFLTATPFKDRDGKEPIIDNIDNYIVYRLSKQDAIVRGYIRDSKFKITKQDNILNSVIKKVNKRKNSNLPHQAMIIVKGQEIAEKTAKAINENGMKYNVQATFYHCANDYRRNLIQFNLGKIDIMVIVATLLEGYDNPKISVLGIVCNIKSMMKFTQFIGRAFRKDQADPKDFKAIIYGDEAQKSHYDLVDYYTGDNEEEEDDSDDDE